MFLDAIKVFLGPTPEVRMGIFPLLGAGIIGGKIISGIAKGKAKKAEAKAKLKAQQDLYAARKGQFEAGQARRGSKLDAIQGAIGNVGGSLSEGAPSYSFDPEVLARMKEALPFAETVASQDVSGDPTKGTTWGMVGDLAGGAAEVMRQANLAKKADESGYESGDGSMGSSGINYQTSILEGTPAGKGPVEEPPIDWDAILRKVGG